MKYISTRGGDISVTSAFAIKQGLSPDKGLFMPEKIPSVDLSFIGKLSSLSYEERAAKILSLFLDDFSYEELIADAASAYSKEKFGSSPAPVRDIGDNISILELWHGPTSAFKDMALQIMPRLFSRSIKKCGEGRKAIILVATSGDTGKAALEGYRDAEGVAVKVFYPTDGVSAMQKRQMQTQEGDNLSVSGIYGNFDDAQNAVKEIFSGEKYADELCKRGFFLSSANSINFGRLAPQIVYYFSAYADMCQSGSIAMGEKIDVTVPTGNFGNIFAAYIAKLMGLPIDKLICASNENDVLTEFFTTGRYNRIRPFHATTSPSMDILISSNLERLIYITLGATRCRELMNDLAKIGEYTLTDKELAFIREHFLGYSTNQKEGADIMRQTFKEKNHLIDTHTAVALSAALRYMNDYKAENKMLVVSTATPYKFARDTLSCVFGETADDESAVKVLHELSGVDIPMPIKALYGKPVLHTDIVEKEQMWQSTLEFVNKF
jgi:threonine synthase